MRCWAKNQIGMQREPCVFVVTKAGPPAPLDGCSVTNKTTTSLNVECIPGDSGGSTQHFHAHVFEVANSEENTSESGIDSSEGLQSQAKMNLTSEKGPTFYLNSLSPGTSYMIEIYASNARGQSDRSRLSVTTLFTKNTKLSKSLDGCRCELALMHFHLFIVAAEQYRAHCKRSNTTPSSVVSSVPYSSRCAL